MNSKTILTTFNVRTLGSSYSAVSIVGTGKPRPYGEDINTVTANFSACNSPLIFCQHLLNSYNSNEHGTRNPIVTNSSFAIS